jgi:hypothetical protein
MDASSSTPDEVFLRSTDEGWSFCTGPTDSAVQCPLALPFVSSVRWWPEGERLLVTGTPEGRRVPDVRPNEKGDLALHEWQPGSGELRLLYRGYAHDPVAVNGGFAVHRGAGLSFLDGAGKVVREHKVGRFNWGAPSLSASPDGEVVAWIRWRGDDRRLCAESVSGDLSTEFRVSVSRYAWIDDRRLLYYLGSGLRVLDIATGRHSPLSNQRAAAREADVPDAVLDYLRLPRGQFNLNAHLSGLQVAHDRIWFVALFADWERQLPTIGGLFSCALDGSGWRMVAPHEPPSKIRGFRVLADGTLSLYFATYNRTRVVDRFERHIGPLATFLDGGWAPFRPARCPNSGFTDCPTNA